MSASSGWIGVARLHCMYPDSVVYGAAGEEEVKPARSGEGAGRKESDPEAGAPGAVRGAKRMKTLSSLARSALPGEACAKRRELGRLREPTATWSRCSVSGLLSEPIEDMSRVQSLPLPIH